MRRSEKIGLNIFDAASAPVRMQILRLLSTKGPLPYTEIMFSLKLDPVRDAGKFVYHMRTLTEAGLISLDKRGKKYEITELGNMVVDFSRDVEEYVSVKRGKLYVRTSRFAIEEFHRSKIAKSLTVEAGVPQELADEIAAEAEDRLMRLRTTYLTAPLIREFVNAILIEKKLEEYRHKLTRLGMPVYDVSQLLVASGERSLDAESVKRSAGSNVLAEYVLLDCLPHEIADAHLGGLIHINNLDSWVLKPNEVQHDLRYFLKNGLPGLRPPDSFNSVLTIIQTAYRLAMAEASGEQGVDLFNIYLAPYVEDMHEDDVLESLSLFFTAIREDLLSNAVQPGLSLGLEFAVPEFVRAAEAIGPGGRIVGNYGDYEEEATLVLEAAVEAASQASVARPMLNPRLIFKVRDRVLRNEELRARLMKVHELAASRSIPYFAFLKDDEKDCYTATGLRLSDEWTKQWEADCTRTGSMDTIFVNLPRVAYEARKEDDRFLSLLKGALGLIVEAFKVKRKFMGARFKEGLLPLLTGTGGPAPYFYERNASYNVALLGLNEAVASHTGSELKKETLEFAMKIAQESSKEIRGLSEDLEMRLTLALRPGDEAAGRLAELDVEKYGKSVVTAQGLKGHPFYTDLPAVPLSSKMPLEERLAMEGRFQAIAAGGHLHLTCLAPEANTPELLMKAASQVAESNIKLFTYTGNYSYCRSCNRTDPGILAKCSACGSDKLSHFGRSSATFTPLALWPDAKRRVVDKRVAYSLS